MSNVAGVDGGGDTLSDHAYRQIEAMIVTRVLPPGAMISENRLSEEIGCGRTPIREALLRLKLEGFVEIHPRRGALVTPVDVMKQLELLEVRRPLEDLVARLAAERANAGERAEMRAMADEIEAAARASDRARYLKANRAIHEIRTRAARNGMLARTMAGVLGLSRRFWYAYIEDTDSFSEAAALHASILRTIADGLPEEAAGHSEKLLNFLDGLTRRALSHHI